MDACSASYRTPAVSRPSLPEYRRIENSTRAIKDAILTHVQLVTVWRTNNAGQKRETMRRKSRRWQERTVSALSLTFSSIFYLKCLLAQMSSSIIMWPALSQMHGPIILVTNTIKNFATITATNFPHHSVTYIVTYLCSSSGVIWNLPLH